MKICGIIAEYNPFHLGHLKQIRYVKENLQADKIVVILSGNFTQRGEPAIMDKYTRAKHAVLAGADFVIELPTVFAVSNAETFTKGAVSILNSLGIITHLCFGVESGDKETYLGTAVKMLDESKEFKAALKKELATGVSHAKARLNALKEVNGDDLNEDLLVSPNNILGLEYTKAILRLNSKMEIVPILRTGDHNDKTLYKGETSATSIRETFKVKGKGKIKNNVPPFVFKDFNKTPYDFSQVIMTALITKTAQQIALSPDCSEGLENRIKAFIKDNKDLSLALNKITTKRYTSSRVRRIVICSLLGITKDLTERCLKSKLYAKALAVKGEFLPLISDIKKNNAMVLIRKNDYRDLEKTALECFNIDVVANELYNFVSGKTTNEYHTEIL